mmetsp:Transcript_123491/g.357068  ORF Transcript_123491/g.357068 Transcript_123491/m.357068 type:complete len:226 (+) Transcript_123491:1121-1798(+)
MGGPWTSSTPRRRRRKRRLSATSARSTRGTWTTRACFRPSSDGAFKMSPTAAPAAMAERRCGLACSAAVAPASSAARGQRGRRSSSRGTRLTIARWIIFGAATQICRRRSWQSSGRSTRERRTIRACSCPTSRGAGWRSGPSRRWEAPRQGLRRCPMRSRKPTSSRGTQWTTARWRIGGVARRRCRRRSSRSSSPGARMRTTTRVCLCPTSSVAGRRARRWVGAV